MALPSLTSAVAQLRISCYLAAGDFRAGAFSHTKKRVAQEAHFAHLEQMGQVVEARGSVGVAGRKPGAALDPKTKRRPRAWP